MFLYMIRNTNDELYVGISNEPKKRLDHHNSKRGAYLTHAGNFKIVFLEEHSSIEAARKREVQIKKWSRVKKDFLIDLYNKGQATK